MAGRGRQTFNKRQKEQQRKEKQQEKLAKRAQRKLNPLGAEIEEMGEAERIALEEEDRHSSILNEDNS